MTLFQALILGAVQGATEFLPVSSSGHLVLVPWLLGWPAPTLAFGAVTHWATAVAVVAFFWDDLVRIVVAAVRWLAASARSRDVSATAMSDDARLGLLIVLGSVPAAALGLMLEDFFEEAFARPGLVASLLLVTAAVLVVSERYGRRTRQLPALGWIDSVLVGLAQAGAILPGISRSGVTIAAGLGRGLERVAAARYSLLLSVPIVLGAGLVKVVDLSAAGDLAAAAPTLLVGFASALVVGIVAVRFLMRHLQGGRLYPFAVYCALFGGTCLVLVFVRGA